VVCGMFCQAMHGDFDIVSISPLPAQPLVFGPLQEVIHEFLEDHLRVHAIEIQPSHLGHALVRFANAHDRDLMINNSPHPYGDVLLDFVRHDQVGTGGPSISIGSVGLCCLVFL
jgi:hypothetical protein